MAPPIVCASTYHPQDGLRIWPTSELPACIERVFGGSNPVLMHGGAYDACCILEWYPELRHTVWNKYEADQVLDSIETERIIEISTGVRGKLALDELARRYGVTITKSDVRTDFGRYLGQPLSAYSAEHIRYVGGDAAELYTLHQRQMSRGIAAVRDIADLTRGSLWLRLCSNYGIRTDGTRVDALERATQEEIEELTELAQEWGAMRTTRTPKQLRENGWFSRNTKVIKARVKEAYGENYPRTEREDVSISKIALDESGDPKLEAIAHLGELLAVRNKDVKFLRDGVHQPIHTRFGYAATTRTTSSGPNVQNFRRKAGIRECLIPRDGCCFVETDYPSLELFALAQVCAWKLNRYDLVQNMNSGKDYHAVIAAGILKTTYEDVRERMKTDPTVKNARDCGKYGNYGLCGYMTDPATFAFYVNMGSRTDENPRGLQWTTEKAAEVMELWRRNATDPVAFLRYVDTLRNSVGLYDVEIPGTTIVRRGCTRTAAANTHFQGLGARIARVAGWKIAKHQYISCDMPSRTVDFVHDAFLAECRIEDRDQVAMMQEVCMAEALHDVCPDMEIYPESLHGARQGVTLIDSAAQDHYSKNAKSKRDAAGSLIVCRV